MPLEREALTEWKSLLNWLGPTPAQAGWQYESIRQKLLIFFERHQCAPADEWADKTFDVVAHKLAAGEIIRTDSPAAYCLGVARMLLKTFWRAPERKLIPLEPTATFNTRDEQAAFNDEVQFACLAECLAKLPVIERELIQNYYHDEWQQQLKQRQALARRFAGSA